MLSWTWRPEQADGSVREGVLVESFPCQGDAESWIGESWGALREQGVDQVTLLEGDREVYGPMSLNPVE